MVTWLKIFKPNDSTEKLGQMVLSQVTGNHGFVLLLDGWTHRCTHFLAVLASFMENSELNSVLLSFSPLIGETVLNATELVTFLETVLEIFDRTPAKVVAVVADNCELNKAICDILTELPFKWVDDIWVWVADSLFGYLVFWAQPLFGWVFWCLAVFGW